MAEYHKKAQLSKMGDAQGLDKKANLGNSKKTCKRDCNTPSTTRKLVLDFGQEQLAALS